MKEVYKVIHKLKEKEIKHLKKQLYIPFDIQS